MTEASERLHIVREAAPQDLDGAVLAESWSNDAWLTDDLVLRVCWRGDRQRFARERALLDSLPASVPHAIVEASGQIEGLAWMALRRIPGQRLDLVWPRLSVQERRDAVLSLAKALESLHHWTPPPLVRQSLQQALLPAPGATPGEIVGAALLPLPVSSILPLLAWLDDQPEMAGELVGAARLRIDELRPFLTEEEFTGGVVVHSDASLANVWWHHGRLAALLDLEWARLGPPDLEFATMFGGHPDLQVTPGETARAQETTVLAWLREGYPTLFAGTHLTERLWLYDICFQIRQLCAYRSFGASSLSRLASLTRRPRVQFD